MDKNLKGPETDYLFKAILNLKDVHECYDFFDDICTVNELLSLSQRFAVAAMLREGKTYIEIAEKTKASTATISRVNRSLNYGNGAYDKLFGILPDYSDFEKNFNSSENKK
jgi:TrpR-related protein YerC/YecD